MPLDASPVPPDPARPSRTAPDRAELDGPVRVDLRAEVAAALAGSGRGSMWRTATALAREALALGRGPGRLTPAEYLAYRLWEPGPAREDRRAFVGKAAQAAMHLACNSPLWHASAADKLLFHAAMAGAGLPRPDLLAVAGGPPAAHRGLPGVAHLPNAAAVAAFLRRPDAHPILAKPVAGKYSLGVLSADGFDRDADELLVVSPEADRTPVAAAAGRLAAEPGGALLQRRLSPHPALAARFGPRLWSVRILVLLGPDGGAPRPHRATAKIATGANPADNFWRPGNMLGALDPATGRITRVVRGTGAARETDPSHPDTGAPIAGTALPDWAAVADLALRGARLFPGLGTQSWDVALAAGGPVALEMNPGGDLNLHQHAHGRGVLDDAFRAHLRAHGQRGRS